VHFAGDGEVVAGLLDEVRSWPLRRAGAELAVGQATRLARFDRLRSTKLAPDGRTLFVVDRMGLHLLDLSGRKLERSLPAYPGMATAPAICPGGRFVFTGTWKGAPGALWDLDAGKMVERFPGSHVVGSFSPDGKWLCVGDARSYRFHEVGTWRVVHEHQRGDTDDLAVPMAFTPDGRMAAIPYSRYVTRLIDAADGGLIASLENPEGVATSALAFDRGADLLAVVTPVTNLLAWDLRRIRTRLRELDLDWRDR
jgi:hypothetical protein